MGIVLFFNSCSSNSLLVKNVYGEQEISPSVLKWKLDQEKNPGVHLFISIVLPIPTGKDRDCLSFFERYHLAQPEKCAPSNHPPWPSSGQTPIL